MKYKVIDLFAGVGGMSLGFEMAGFDVVLANEYDKDIATAYKKNHSPSNKAYELYGNQICHDTDRSFVVWFDEEECKYIELKEIKPIRPNTYDDYELNIKILYGDAED